MNGYFSRIFALFLLILVPIYGIQNTYAQDTSQGPTLDPKLERQIRFIDSSAEILARSLGIAWLVAAPVKTGVAAATVAATGQTSAALYSATREKALELTRARTSYVERLWGIYASDPDLMASAQEKLQKGVQIANQICHKTGFCQKLQIDVSKVFLSPTQAYPYAGIVTKKTASGKNISIIEISADYLILDTLSYSVETEIARALLWKIYPRISRPMYDAVKKTQSLLESLNIGFLGKLLLKYETEKYYFNFDTSGRILADFILSEKPSQLSYSGKSPWKDKSYLSAMKESFRKVIKEDRYPREHDNAPCAENCETDERKARIFRKWGFTTEELFSAYIESLLRRMDDENESTLPSYVSKMKSNGDSFKQGQDFFKTVSQFSAACKPKTIALENGQENVIYPDHCLTQELLRHGKFSEGNQSFLSGTALWEMGLNFRTHKIAKNLVEFPENYGQLIHESLFEGPNPNISFYSVCGETGIEKVFFNLPKCEGVRFAELITPEFRRNLNQMITELGKLSSPEGIRRQQDFEVGRYGENYIKLTEYAIWMGITTLVTERFLKWLPLGKNASPLRQPLKEGISYYGRILIFSTAMMTNGEEITEFLFPYDKFAVRVSGPQKKKYEFAVELRAILDKYAQQRIANTKGLEEELRDLIFQRFEGEDIQFLRLEN